MASPYTGIGINWSNRMCWMTFIKSIQIKQLFHLKHVSATLRLVQKWHLNQFGIMQEWAQESFYYLVLYSVYFDNKNNK